MKKEPILKKCDYLPVPLDINLNINKLIDDSLPIYEELAHDTNLYLNNIPILIGLLNFGHIVTSYSILDKRNYKLNKKYRAYDKERLCTIPWLLYILRHCINSECSDIKIEMGEDLKARVTIECQKEGYKIILGKRPKINEYYLVTAYLSKKKHSSSRVDNTRCRIKTRY